MQTDPLVQESTLFANLYIPTLTLKSWHICILSPTLCKRNYEDNLLKRVFKEVFPRDVNFHMPRQWIRLEHNTRTLDWLTHSNAMFIRYWHYTHLARVTNKTSYQDISLWPLATSQTHEVSALIQFSSAFSSHHSVTFGSRALWFSTPRVWNSLPVSIRESQSLPTFILFSVSLPSSSCPRCLE